MLHVLFIQPDFLRNRLYDNNRRSLVPPMMFHYLAKPLREDGFNYDVLDLATYAISDTRLKEYVQHWNPRIVGISSVTENFFSALRLGRFIKSIKP